ncbi:hypothetical protein LTR08_000740 [Meristemomyces frigidus]|nr:hypothetical protein LTR08_000740 [Meristemomyces frigidus]
MVSRTVVLVTGGNSGIGYEAVKALLQSSKSHRIILGSRDEAKAQSAIETLQQECPDSKSSVEALQVDLTNDESIEIAFEKLKTDPGHIDALVNNAGASFDSAYTRGKLSLHESFTKSYDVNLAGTHLLTHTFMPLLLKSSDPRLIFVGGLSRMTEVYPLDAKYFPTPPLKAGWPKTVGFETIAYRCSKTALNMLMIDWRHKLKADGVKVWSVMPGMLATNLGGYGPKMAADMGAGDPSLGGTLLRSVVEGERDVEAGKVIGRDGESAL